MAKPYLLLIIFLTAFLLYSCSKRNHPGRSPENNTTSNSMPDKPVDTLAVTKPVIKKPKEPIPKVIVVNDKVAHKSIDGRLYYDLMGHRYWRNNVNGKYYLYNKSMYNNKAFNKPAK
ncbi:MAG: hypothetical protein H0W12_00685 [Chitinophagaceae bacterium]|nr:hypothetical protein [Chitinophagaceae bacterium]